MQTFQAFALRPSVSACAIDGTQAIYLVKLATFIACKRSLGQGNVRGGGV